MMDAMTIIEIKNLSKTYASGTSALKNVSLSIAKGEIFALLGPNGAGKTTLIGIVTGVVNKTSGTVTVMGKDIVRDYRFTRSHIGLVPQELLLDPFLTVEEALRYQRGFYGKKRDDALIKNILQSLSLWDKRAQQVRTLSGGMKRRVLIGKALTNEPSILFLDEPTAGVDVELRKDMWAQIARLRDRGTTIILTTHYIEEAELMADRIGIITGGELKIVERKSDLLEKLGDKKLLVTLAAPLPQIPATLAHYHLALSENGTRLSYSYGASAAHVTTLLADLERHGIAVHDIDTRTRSLEEIFVELINQRK